jgi:glucose-1-phosphate adenylyltransferase
MNALGIICFENGSAYIEGLSDYRPVPAIAFMGRYRVVDFILSNMTNSGIDSVEIYCKEKPRNLIEHLGDGKHYNINSKRGKLRILYGEKSFSSPVYNHDVANYVLNMEYIENDPNEFVIIAPSYFVYSLDFHDVLKAHLDSKADVTMVYTASTNAKEDFLGCDTLTLDKDRRITEIGKNRGSYKSRNISMECMVMTKKMFIDLVKKAAATSSLYWLKDCIADSLGELNVRGYQYHGFVACLNSLKEYYKVSMELRDPEISEHLFKPDWPIYTQTNDSSPSIFTNTAEVSDTMVANGCHVQGKVTGSILSRNVTVCEGAEISNSIILPGAYIGENAKLDHVIVDKYAIVHHVKKLEGTDEAPVYVRRRDRI